MASSSLGWALPANTNWTEHGPGEQRKRSVGIVAEEPEPLVRRVAPREPDREYVGVERAGRRLDPCPRLVLGEPVDPAAFLDELHELRALLAPRVPQLGVGHRFKRRPGRDLARPPPPVLAEVAVEQAAHRRPDPARQVHAVGDMSNRHRLNRPPRPQAPATSHARTPPWRRLTPLAARLIRKLNCVISERLSIILGVAAAQPQQSLWVDAQLRHEIPDRADYVLAGIGLVAGRDRRVRGEHRTLASGRECRLQRRSARRLSARQLEHRKRSMPLI